MTDDRGQRTEDRGQKTDYRGQRTDYRGQRTEDRRPITEKIVICYSLLVIGFSEVRFNPCYFAIIS
jgi:hypothetical protein